MGADEWKDIDADPQTRRRWAWERRLPAGVFVVKPGIAPAKMPALPGWP